MNDDAENRRVEYAAIVGYHGSLVTARFTIAGLVIASSAFLASAVFGPGGETPLKVAGAAIGAWLSFAVWVLELRTRALYRLIARRGVDIEHNAWGLKGRNWYEGAFSRQYKTPPEFGEDTADIPALKTLPSDPVSIFGWSPPRRIARQISHSNAFDLLYGGTTLFWSRTAIWLVSRR